MSELTKTVVVDTILDLLARFEAAGMPPKVSPTVVCEELRRRGFDATRGFYGRPVREVFDFVCDVASTTFVYTIHGNTRSITL